MNERPIKLIAVLLIFTITIGTLIHILEDHKMDDEPPAKPYTLTFTVTNSTNVGTATTTTTL